MNINDSVITLKGLGPKKEKSFNELGIYTLGDLLTFYPRTYLDKTNLKSISQAIPGEKESFLVVFKTLLEDRRIKRNLHLTSFAVTDGDSIARVSFFNNRFIKSMIDLEEKYVLTGKVSVFNRQIQITSPDFIKYEDYLKQPQIYPIYPLSKKVRNIDLTRAINQVLDKNLFEENLPEYLIKKYGLMDKNKAIYNLHRPKDKKTYISARQRLVFEELFLFQLNLLMIKKKNQDQRAKVFTIDERIYKFIEGLKFELTEGQKNVVEEIFNDLKSSKRMNRLIQGDVGSGKTIVAIIAMYLAYLNGYQSSIMVPTEILAKQHLKSFRDLLEPLGVRVELLVGSTSQKNRNRILAGLETGEIDILIGTHALINENVRFRNLALNVTDEQHRFGVKQREAFVGKDLYAHTLVMTATPIPRTLTLVLYSDLDISVINTLPPNRKKIKTIAINKTMLNRALNFIKSEVKKGRQAYIIAPLIEESEKLELDSAMEIYESLKSDYFEDLNLALLHGKMENQEKDLIMKDFKEHKIDIIISTTVIEVGINVANATVILVYNAERFGLAQLHQLRGRVGRSSYESYCILYNSSTTDISWKRMKVLENSNDGFFIANKDLDLRGSGDIFGTRQSGFMNFKLADLVRDVDILKYTNLEAMKLLEEDPKLELLGNSSLKESMNQFFTADLRTLN
ncbi:ATP-dependent DNA helicase RecG [Peptoniphilus catoniae]|uniref:ATP-dependent DNA helicase RecG n=1 Tax=Peptoniphilus catoniae TaxID=1660341 RepID=UPI0010FD92E8|nr:ATP-dependent DNA helicase RecG [Peptoniphilus catoniae]